MQLPTIAANIPQLQAEADASDFLSIRKISLSEKCTPKTTDADLDGQLILQAGFHLISFLFFVKKRSRLASFKL